MTERDWEAEARKEGWKPEGEWEGDPPKGGFKSAKQFVEDGERITPILQRKVESLEGRVEQLLNSNEKLNDFAKRSIEKEKKEKESLIKELEEARKKAVTEGDGELFERANAQIEDLKTSPEQKETKNDIDPNAKKWLEQNPWYTTDENMGAFADGTAERLLAQGYTYGSEAYFKELTERTKAAFPNKFENPNRNKANGVEDGTRGSGGSDAKTFDNLPPEAKQEFKNWERDIPGFTKEQFLEQYDWSEE